MGIDVGELLLHAPPLGSLQGSRTDRCQERTMRGENPTGASISQRPCPVTSESQSLLFMSTATPPSCCCFSPLTHRSLTEHTQQSESKHPSSTGTEVQSPDHPNSVPSNSASRAKDVTGSLWRSPGPWEPARFLVTFNSSPPQDTSKEPTEHTGRHLSSVLPWLW